MRPLLLGDGDVVVADARQVLRQLDQLVVVRREERLRLQARAVVQVLDDRARDRHAVVGARAAADLVEDQQRARRRVVQDRARLDHLHHERRLPRRQVVAGADAREDAVDEADRAPTTPARSCRTAPSARSARPGAGRSTCRPCSGPVSTTICASPDDSVRVVRHEGARRERALDHRVPPVADLDRGRRRPAPGARSGSARRPRRARRRRRARRPRRAVASTCAAAAATCAQTWRKIAVSISCARSFACRIWLSYSRSCGVA